MPEPDKVSDWAAYLNDHPAFKEHHGDIIGDWEPGDPDVVLDGKFTIEELTAMAEYMNKFKSSP